MNKGQSIQHESLVGKIKNAPTIRAMDYLQRVQRITNSKNFRDPSMDKLEEIIGSKLFSQVEDSETEWPDYEINEKIFKNKVTIDEMEQWLKINEIAHKSYEERISLLDKWIEQHKVNNSKLSVEMISAFPQK